MNVYNETDVSLPPLHSFRTAQRITLAAVNPQGTPLQINGISLAHIIVQAQAHL